MRETDWQATVIKILAVVTATPRWVGALLAAEGLVIPTGWASGWVIASAVMSAAMAAVEGWAFSYVFEAWRNQEDKNSNRLGWLILVSAALFVIVLAPYIATSVTHEPLSATLVSLDGNKIALYVWSVAVGGSTIAIVASVGYAQKHKGAKKGKPSETDSAPKTQLAKQDAIETKQAEPESEPITKEARILAAHQENPQYKSPQIANITGASPQYVRRVLATKDGKLQ